MAVLSKKGERRIPWLLIGLALLGAAVAAWFVWGRPQTSDTEANAARQTAPVVRQDINLTVSAAGVVKPLTPVNISPKQPGRLAKLLVDQGDRVRAGQVLARMDDTNLQGGLLQAQGTLQAAEANLRKLQAGNRRQEILQAEQNLRDAQAQLIAARSTYESNTQLLAAGAIGRNALDVSRSQYESNQARIGALQQQLDLLKAGFRAEDIDAARAQVTQARGALKTIQAQINDTVIRAPFAGLITQKFANPGAFVTPTTSASATTSATSSSVLAMAGDLEAVANVAESDVRNIFPGQAVDLRVDAFPGRVFKGQVRLVAPEAIVVQNVTSFEVRIKLIDVDKSLIKSGMNLTASFRVGERKGALLIPTTAVVSEAEGTGVYVLAGEKPRFKRVQVGPTVGTQTQVLSGLQQGEKVFITFPTKRKPNDRPVRNNSPLGGGGGPRGGNRPPR